MKKLIFSCLLLAFFLNPAFAQEPFNPGDKIIFSNDDVVFRQIDEHTWVGTGNEMWNESLYLVEGSERSILIDAGTSIKDLDKIVASITDKPVTLVATHVHPDHTGSSIKSFHEIYVNPGDTDLIPVFMPDYEGNVKYLKDGETISLGNRQLEVVFTPGHTKGSTTFLDKTAGYGFSGDSFGTGLLLLSTDFSTFITSCKRISSLMEEKNIRYLYTGHHDGANMETLNKIKDMLTLSRNVLSGNIKGFANPDNTFGLNLAVEGEGYRIIFNETAVK